MSQFLGTVALLLVLGCPEDRLDAVMALLSVRVVPEQPTEVVAALRKAMEDAGV